MEGTVTRTSTSLSFKFVVETKRLLVYACESIYLITKDVILAYVQEQGEILLKFSILALHCVTHYCTRILPEIGVIIK